MRCHLKGPVRYNSNILYLVHAPKLLRSNPGLRKGICCTSLKELKQKIEKKFPPGSSSLPIFTDDETEVGWIVLQKRSSMRTGWRWWLPDEPGSTELIGGWKTHQHSTNAWEHLWQTTFTPSRERWSVCCLQSGGYKPHQDGLSHYHRLHEKVLDFMAEDFHRKWNQMQHSIKMEDGLTKVGGDGGQWLIWLCFSFLECRPPAAKTTLLGLPTSPPMRGPKKSSWIRIVRWVLYIILMIIMMASLCVLYLIETKKSVLKILTGPN